MRANRNHRSGACALARRSHGHSLCTHTENQSARFFQNHHRPLRFKNADQNFVLRNTTSSSSDLISLTRFQKLSASLRHKSSAERSLVSHAELAT